MAIKAGVLGNSRLQIATPQPRLVPPPSAYEMIHGTPITLGENDIHGTCLVVMAFNAGNVTAMREDGIALPVDNTAPFALYTKLGGMPADQGLDSDVLLDYWTHYPINGYKLDSVTSIPLNDVISMKWAIVDTGFLLCTVLLDEAQMSEQEWVVTRGSPALGGHGCLGTGYIANRLRDDTWGAVESCDWDFLSSQGREVWRGVLKKS